MATSAAGASERPGRPPFTSPTGARATIRSSTPAAPMKRSRRRPPQPGGSVYGKLTNRSLKSVALAASPRSGVTPKISWSERNVELWV